MKNSCIIIEGSQQIRKIKYDDICHLYYMDGVITFELVNDNKVMCCSQLIELEKTLPEYYVRINRNAIINISFLTAYYKHTQKVMMENGKHFYVSRRNVSTLVKKMKELYPMVR